MDHLAATKKFTAKWKKSQELNFSDVLKTIAF